MKGKKGGKSNRNKGGKKKGKEGKKPPQQAPRADAEPGFVLPDSERDNFIPGFGCMVTKQWATAYQKDDSALMVEIARTNIERYGDKVTDVQSKASLLRMLGYSLARAPGGELPGLEYNLEAMNLVESGERSIKDIVTGVWPESCVNNWSRMKWDSLV
jgi:hypothetical protein